MKDYAYSFQNQRTTKAVSQMNQQQAAELLADALVLQNELFDQGDLIPYLNMLSRMCYQNSRNLLLLMVRFPTAQCLTGYQVWRKHLPNPMSPVLRPDQKGKGIKLLVPFSDLERKAVTWCTAVHYDVSQVNTDFDSFKGPYQPFSENHLPALLSSLHFILGEFYGISVTIAEDPEDLEGFQAADTAGQIFPGYFLLRPELTLEDKVRWLTQALCQLYLQQHQIPIEYEVFLSSCAARSLFEIWGTPQLAPSCSNPALVMSVQADLRQPILDLLQRCVWTLDAQICKPYTETLTLEAAVFSESEA